MQLRDVHPRDAIVSLDEPQFAPEHAGEPDDEVLVVETSPPRAYPVRILSSHEVVNDALATPLPAPLPAPETREPAGGRRTGAAPVDRIAVTWCPICWSAAVYDARVDGDALTFGVSGNLADDALVLYDRQTGSQWQQTTGRAIEGPLSGRELDVLPFATTTAGAFAERYPDGLVLQPARGGADPAAALDQHYAMAPYEAYREREGFGLQGMRGEGASRPWERDDLDAKDLVLGVELGREAVGFPEPDVREAGGLVGAEVGGRDALVVATDAGLHAFAAPEHDLDVLEDDLGAVDGGRLNVVKPTSSDERSESDGGGQVHPGDLAVDLDELRARVGDLERLPARQLFAFAWQDAHGANAFFERA